MFSANLIISFNITQNAAQCKNSIPLPLFIVYLTGYDAYQDLYNRLESQVEIEDYDHPHIDKKGILVSDPQGFQFVFTFIPFLSQRVKIVYPVQNFEEMCQYYSWLERYHDRISSLNLQPKRALLFVPDEDLHLEFQYLRDGMTLRKGFHISFSNEKEKNCGLMDPDGNYIAKQNEAVIYQDNPASFWKQREKSDSNCYPRCQIL